MADKIEKISNLKDIINSHKICFAYAVAAANADLRIDEENAHYIHITTIVPSTEVKLERTLKLGGENTAVANFATNLISIYDLICDYHNTQRVSNKFPHPYAWTKETLTTQEQKLNDVAEKILDNTDSLEFNAFKDKFNLVINSNDFNNFIFTAINGRSVTNNDYLEFGQKDVRKLQSFKFKA